jgi:hypothetical protein|tara:strand:- start:324 stop:461 length:138 start_codon:yes stop_codon:yes gene_type:complete
MTPKAALRWSMKQNWFESSERKFTDEEIIDIIALHAKIGMDGRNG